MRSRAVQPAAFLMLMCSISWHPEGGKKVAIAYSVLQFQQQPTDMSLSSYVWDVTNPNYPDLELVPASGAACPLLLLHASALLRDWRVTRLRSARVSRVQHQGSAPHSRRLLQRPFAVSRAHRVTSGFLYSLRLHVHHSSGVRLHTIMHAST